MSKSILVLDMPDACCRCRFSGSDGGVYDLFKLWKKIEKCSKQEGRVRSGLL